MKKYISILSILFCLTIFLGCNTNETEEKIKEVGAFVEWGLDVKTEVQIRRDYLEKYIRPQFPEAGINDVWVEKFYGIYNWPELYYEAFGSYPTHIMSGDRVDYSVTPNNDAIAVIIGSNYDNELYDNEEWEEEVFWRPPFRYSNGNRILFWYERSFYTVTEAQNDYNVRNVFSVSGEIVTTSILDNGGLMSLYSYHCGLSMEKNRQIQKLLCEQDMERIKNNKYPYFGGIYSDNFSVISPITVLDWYWVNNYYGTYNKCVVIIINLPNIESRGGYINVGGIRLRYEGIRLFYVLHEKQLYEWEEAFNVGLIDIDDAKLITHRYYNCRAIVNENLEVVIDYGGQRLCNPRCYDENGWRN